MPRILFGVTVPVTANAFLRDQLVVLSDLGWDVHLAVSPDKGIDLLECDGRFTVHSVRMKRSFSLADPVSLLSWCRLMHMLKPDIVVASTPKAGLLGILSAKLMRVRIRVYHVRGLRAEGLRGLARHLSLASEWVSITLADQVICDSQSLLSEMRRRRLIGGPKGHVIGAGSCCGVDTERFRPPTAKERRDSRFKLGIANDDLVVGFVGRVTRDKGVVELVSACSALREQHPRLICLVAGPLEDLTESELGVPTGGAKEASWLKLTGDVEDALSIYWALDVFALPSYREGFPISTLEAQSSGLPVVTTTATGCRDSISPEVTGLLVVPRSEDDLARALMELLCDRKKRIAMGHQARAFASQHFEAREVRGRFVEYLSGFVG